MKTRKLVVSCITVFALAILFVFGASVGAEDLSGDNSLYSLGLENGQADPEFYYSTLEYTVSVPEGTKELKLDPIKSDPNATIVDISGTELDENSNGTVMITVEAPNGAQVTYVLNVKADGAAAPTDDKEMTPEEQAQSESEEQLRAQEESEAQLRREAEARAAQERQAKLDKLNADNEAINNRLNMILKICYGLIAFCVILLFFIINQSLRNKDLKDELKEAKAQIGDSYEFARKDQNLRTDYYYAPVQGMPQNGAPMNGFAGMQNVYTTPPQPQQTAPAAEMAAAAPEAEQLSRKEQKKLEKAAKRAAKQAPAEAPAQAPVDETIVHSNVEEPDIDVDMIDL